MSKKILNNVFTITYQKTSQISQHKEELTECAENYRHFNTYRDSYKQSYNNQKYIESVILDNIKDIFNTKYSHVMTTPKTIVKEISSIYLRYKRQ